jgi:hypothetical protein
MPFHAYHEFNILMLSRGDISTKVYLRNRNKYKYNSFIFGSSRSTAHTSVNWEHYLDKNDRAFSFGAWNESVVGVYKRLKLIDSLKDSIKNAFIILDVDHAFDIGKIDWDHYLITGISAKQYYLQHYYSYVQNPRLIFTSIDFALFHKRRKYMNNFAGQIKGDIDPVNNDWVPSSDKKIDADSVNYYKKSADKFYQRPSHQIFSKKLINGKETEILLKTEAVLKKNHTQYKIVIAPLYDQVKINPDDMSVLKTIFGKKNVYDFSGINSITNNKFNYLSDAYHYRKRVGALIFKQIYQGAITVKQ